MAMTKKEREAVDALTTSLRLKAALSWPTFTRPKPKDLKKAFDGKKWDHLEIGWFVNSYTGTVSLGCSSSIHHDRHSTTKTSTQGQGTQYETELDALIETRWLMCEMFSKELDRLDRSIEEAIAIQEQEKP